MIGLMPDCTSAELEIAEQKLHKIAICLAEKPHWRNDIKARSGSKRTPLGYTARDAEEFISNIIKEVGNL